MDTLKTTFVPLTDLTEQEVQPTTVYGVSWSIRVDDEDPLVDTQRLFSNQVRQIQFEKELLGAAHILGISSFIDTKRTTIKLEK